MNSLKDQIEEKIRKERDQPEKSGQDKDRNAGDAGKRLDDIRSRLDELSHTTDSYSLKVRYEKGQYAELIAVIELDDSEGTWVAAWQIAPTVSGSVNDWEVTYNPHGVETQHEWFADSEDLFRYLTTSVAERVIGMEADEE